MSRKRANRSRTAHADHSPSASVGRELVAVRVSRGERGLEIQASGGYAIASGDRTNRSRTMRFEGADRALDISTRRKVISTAREMDRNSLLSAMLDRWVDGTVGAQLNFRPTTGDDGWNKAAYELVRERMRSCDHRGFFDAATLTRTMLRALGTDGEQLWCMTEDGHIQVIETHQIGTPRDKAAAGARIVDGIQLEPGGRPSGYWVSDEMYGGYIRSSSNATFISAANAILPAYRKRATQTHGVPVVAAALKLYDRVDGYIDNESLAAAIDACLTFFIRKKTSEPNLQPNYPGRRGVPDPNGTTKMLQKIEPGMIGKLDSDEEIQQFGAKRPGTQFTPFVEMGLTMVGATIGVPMTLSLLDFKKLNYSNARTLLLQMWQTWQIWHRCQVVPAWQWVYPRWILKEIASSPVLRARSDAFSVKWPPRRWPWVDPLKEVQALREEIAMGVGTLTDQLELLGYTRPEYLAERGAELRDYNLAGVPTTTITGEPAGAMAPPETPDPDEDDDEQDQDEENIEP